MFIFKQKPTSPAKRWSSYIKNKFFKRFEFKKVLHKSVRKGFEVKKTKRKRLVSSNTKYYKLYDTCFMDSKVLSIHKLSYVNFLVASMVFGYGGQYYFKIPEGYHLMFHKRRYKFLSNDNLEFINGEVVQLFRLETGSMCFSLKISKMQGGKVAESAGTFCKILWHETDADLTAMELPSKKFVRINNNSYCRLGRVSNSYFNYTKFGNARDAIVKGKKVISVRGVAMNPVDHPNGGRTNTKQPYRNPWGGIAKKQK